MTTAPEVRITADPDLPTVEIVREFDATPALVFRAHLDPELFLQWIGPDDLDNEIDHWDDGDASVLRSVAGDWSSRRRPSGRAPSSAV